MPYIDMVIAQGRDAATRRRLIAELSQVIVDILESKPEDVHAVLREISVENLGEGGVQPDPRTTNNISVVVARGRAPEVLLALVRRCCDVAVDVLGVEPENVHMLINEILPAHASTAGIPMAGAGNPRWFTDGRPVPEHTPYAADDNGA